MNSSPSFPTLTPDYHRVTSPRDLRYNCIAWASQDDTRWWQPGMHWPVPDWPRDDCGIAALEALFRALGYEDCGMDAGWESGFQKVALYGAGGFLYTHAARQPASGKWTSKLGKGEDIEHDTPDVVAEGVYGEVLQVMKRRLVE